MKLNDKQIRKILINRLSKYKDCFIHEEVNVPPGFARADLVVSNGHLIGYEIKSDVDSFVRLPSQIKEYDYVFEQNYLVVGKKFSIKAFEILPTHWGIIEVAQEKDRKPEIKFLRKAKKNPNQEFKKFIDFLSANDIKYLAKETEKVASGRTRTEIQKTLKCFLIDDFDLYLSKQDKENFAKIVRELFKGKSVQSLYKNGLLL